MRSLDPPSRLGLGLSAVVNLTLRSTGLLLARRGIQFIGMELEVEDLSVWVYVVMTV